MHTIDTPMLDTLLKELLAEMATITVEDADEPLGPDDEIIETFDNLAGVAMGKLLPKIGGDPFMRSDDVNSLKTLQKTLRTYPAFTEIFKNLRALSEVEPGAASSFMSHLNETFDDLNRCSDKALEITALLKAGVDVGTIVNDNHCEFLGILTGSVEAFLVNLREVSSIERSLLGGLGV